MPDIAPPVAAPPPTASTPAPPPPSTPAAPPAPSAAPAAASAPAAVSTGPARLNPKDFNNATDAYMAERAWRAENPDVPLTESPWEGEKPAEAAAPAADGTEAPKVEGEKQPETNTQETATETGDAETFSMDEETALTPQALNDIIKGDEGLKAALEANPIAKNQIFKMAREHAELSQFRGIFPTADSAKFARETADRTVSLRTKFQMADTPEGMASAFDDFMGEFQIVGADGKPALDENGQPMYGDDLYALTEHIVNDRYLANELSEVEERLAANRYGSDEERVRDEDRKIALSILADDFKVKDESSDIDLSGITDENVRKQLQTRADDLKRREQELEAKTGQQPKAKREADRKQNNEKYGHEVGRRTFDQVTSTVDTLRKQGAVIPEWMLTTTLPNSNTPVFFSEVGKAIDQLVKSDPYTRKQFMELEMAPPTPENLQQRVQAFDALMQQTNERGISNIRAIVTKLVRSFAKDVQKNGIANSTTTAPGESREPRTSAAPAPKQMNRDDAYKQAETLNAKEIHGWSNMSDAEKMAYNMSRQRQLLQAR